MSIQIRINNGNDKIRWGFSLACTYNLKEEANSFLTLKTSNINWKKVWKANLWPKISTFLWLLIRKCLLTGENRMKKGCIGPHWCCLYKNNEDSTNHLLDECNLSYQIWNKGERIFRKKAPRNGQPNLTIAQWPYNPFISQLLNRIWKIFLGFAVWEV